MFLLKNKKINFKTDRILRIDNKILSVSFLLMDQNVIIKYWNLKDAEEITNQPGYRKNAYDKYQKAWADLIITYEQSAIKVYQIASASEEDILKQLALLSDINTG